MGSAVDRLLGGGTPTAKSGKTSGASTGAGSAVQRLLDGGTPDAAAPAKHGGGALGFLGRAIHPDVSLLLGTLNLLGRPAQATKSLIQDARTNAGTVDTFKHLGTALAGHSNIGFQQAINTHVKGIPGALLNFAGDVAADPTTYLTFGTGDVAKTGLAAIGDTLGRQTAQDVVEKGAKRVLTDTDRKAVADRLAAAEGGSEKAASKVMKAVDRGGQGGVKVAGRTVVPGARLGAITRPAAAVSDAVRGTKVVEAITPRAGITSTFGKDVADQVGAASARARASVNNGTAEAIDQITKAAKAAKPTTEELRTIVGPAIEDQAVAVPERLQPLVDTLRGIRDTTTARQLAAGTLPEDALRSGYLGRYLTPEATKALDADPAMAEHVFGQAPSEIRSAASQGGHLQPRMFMPDASVGEANDALKTRLGLKGDAYVMDPLVATGRRAAQAERALSQNQLLDDVSKIKDASGHPILTRADSAPRPAGWDEVDAGPLGKFHAPPSVAKEVEHVRAVVTNDKSISEFNGLLGKLNTLWKGYATVPVIGGVGFHARNAEGNVWLNFLAGVKNPVDYAHAAAIQAALAKAGGDLEKLDPVDKRIVELARKHGVLDEGFFHTDLLDPEAAGGRLGRLATDQRGARIKAALNPLSTDNAVLRSGRKVGSAVEDNARLAHFIAKLKSTGNAADAAASVRKYLFDYADLTDFEKTKLKKISAFWTFMRKNTPLQLAELGKQPGKFAALAHGFNAAGGPADSSVFPQWAVDEGMVPVGHGLMAGPDLPFGAAINSIDPAQQSDLGLASGLVPSLAKFAVEAKTKKSLFNGGNIHGSTPERLTDAVFPLAGKIRRSPFGSRLPVGLGIGINDDDPKQELARLIASLTGLNTRYVGVNGPATGAGGDPGLNLPFAPHTTSSKTAKGKKKKSSSAVQRLLNGG